MPQLPISVVIPTKDHLDLLWQTLGSLCSQRSLPKEILIVDASKHCTDRIPDKLKTITRVVKAGEPGAATQRNQGASLTTSDYILFLDDDVTFKNEVLEILWDSIQLAPTTGGVAPFIVNHSYEAPGWLRNAVLTLIHGERSDSWAGKVVGPAIHLLPDARPDLPKLVPVDWLLTGCVLYRKSALPNPPFPPHFKGYSFGEDLALSLQVAKSWRLFVAREAHAHHHFQESDYRKDLRKLSEMEIVNRYYIAKEILKQKGIRPVFSLTLWESFHFAAMACTPKYWPHLGQILMGKIDGLCALRKK